MIVLGFICVVEFLTQCELELNDQPLGYLVYQKFIFIAVVTGSIAKQFGKIIELLHNFLTVIE